VPRLSAIPGPAALFGGLASLIWFCQRGRTDRAGLRSVLRALVLAAEG
jgi:hypothetical protein